MTATPTKKTPRGYLATPLTPVERRSVDRMYREHGGLVNHMGRKMCRKYPAILKEDIFSCIDIAFIKTCRAWNPDKGTFSTLLGVFCEGEIRHFIRDHNWTIKAPGAVRSLGLRARYLLKTGETHTSICTKLAINTETLKLALFAVQSIDHDIKDFKFHTCPRPTPWELLDAE
jgi:DNA-directed RNA polymerase specialized sigma subunit